MTFPSGWAEATIGEIALTNPKHHTDTDRNQTVSFVAMPAVDEHLGVITGAADRILDEIWTGYTHFSDGDVIFAKITPCMENGKAAIASGLTNGLACGSTEFFVLRPAEGISADFLWRFLRQASFRREAERQMTGAVGQRRVPRAFLEGASIPLPPSAEQRRIVAKLDALIARIAQARAELDRVPVLAERLRLSTVERAFRGTLTADWRSRNTEQAASDDALSEAYVRFSGTERKRALCPVEWRPDIEIPDSWRWVSVDQVIGEARYGTSTKASDDTASIPVLRMGNIQRGSVDWKSLKYLPADHEELPALLLSDGDVLFNRTNSHELVGKSAVFRDTGRAATFASYLIRIRCTAINPNLLVRYLNSSFGRAWISRVATQQVGQANVNGTKLKSLGIPLPPASEQDEMNRILEAVFARADRLETEAAHARRLLDRLEAATLTKGFRGELVPQDPKDEPASVLLERIRTEREAAPKPKRKRLTAAADT